MVGGLVDRSMQASPTFRDVATSPRDATTLVALADAIGGQGRYRLFLEIERSSPRSAITLDDRVRAHAHFQESYLYALSGAREFQRERLDVQLVAGASETASGSFRGRDWRLHLLEPGSIGSELLVWREGRTLIIADGRLVTGRSTLGELNAEADTTIGSPRLRRATLVDAALLTGLFLAGGALIPAAGSVSVLRGGLALVVGFGLQAAVGILRLPGLWSMLAAMATAAALSLLAKRAGHDVGWSRRDLPLIGIGAASILAVSVVARWIGFIWVSVDSVEYLAQSRMLADGFFTARNVDVKRGLGQQSIHAPGFALGVEGLQSLGLATLVVAVLLVAALPLALQVSRPAIACSVSTLLAGGLLASPAFPIMASYVNSHVLVAVLLLGIALLLGVQSAPADGAQDQSSAGMYGVGVLVAGLVLLRPEGTLLAAVMLIGASGVKPDFAGKVLRVLGGMTIVWNLVLIQAYAARGDGAPTLVIAMLMLGVGFLVLPFALERIPQVLATRLPLITSSALWGLSLLLVALGGEGVNFFRAATANLGQGLGNWGALGLAMVILGVAVAGWPLPERAGAGAHAARWMLVSFVPMTMVARLGDGLQRSGAGLDVLLSGGGSIGWGDSVNRMWTHVMLLVLLVAVTRVSAGRSATEASATSRKPRMVADAP